MPYYDKIAKQWHQATGYKGGAFKKYVLNDILLEKLTNIDQCSILELGAGNGYFLPLILQHFSGQKPNLITITDESSEQLKNAVKYFCVPGAQYQPLDIRRLFPFNDNGFDIILAIMVLNEVPPIGFKNAIKESYRVLSNGGIFLIAVTHPQFIGRLQKLGLLQRTKANVLTMPGTGNLRLPVIVRPAELYLQELTDVGFECELEDVYPTQRVLNEKQGMRNIGKVPLALVILCSKPGKSK